MNFLVTKKSRDAIESRLCFFSHLACFSFGNFSFLLNLTYALLQNVTNN